MFILGISLIGRRERGNMIKVEGYKAFHGGMNISPIDPTIAPFCIVNKDWLYKPDTNCWYGAGRSFPAEICEPIEEENN